MGGRFALLVATTSFDHLRPLESPAHDVRELEKLLSDPAVGRYSVISCVNEPYEKTREQIEEFFQGRAPDDHVLLYVSTHGLKDDHGNLYFASRNTSPLKLHSTTFESSLIHRLSRACHARQQVFILDSCFSGAFGRAVDGRSKGAQRLQRQDVLGAARAEAGSGVVVMAGSTSFQLSYEMQEDDKPGPSVFTRSIVEGIGTGSADADGDGRITADELFNYAQAATRRLHPGQTPQKWVIGAVGDIEVARAAGGRLPNAIIKRLRSRHTEQRLLAVTILEDLCRGESQGHAQAARQQLQELAKEDDSQRVRLAAQTAIDRVTVPPLQPERAPVPPSVQPLPPAAEPVAAPPGVEPAPAPPTAKPEEPGRRRLGALVRHHITDLPPSLRYLGQITVAVVIALAAWMLLSVQVPDVTGKRLDEATRTISEHGLTIRSTRRVEDEHREGGTVSEQQPKAGNLALRRTGVTLTVATAPTVNVPSLAGMTYTEARQVITSAGLTTRRQAREVPDSGMVGKVVEQAPPAGSKVDKGSEVVLTLGAAMRSEVPNVVGRDLAEARQILNSHGLQAGTVSTADTLDAPAGHVVRQIPAAGASVQRDQGVDLVLARAPPTPSKPAAPLSKPPPGPQLTSTGFVSVKPVRISGSELQVHVTYTYRGEHGTSGVFIHAIPLEQGSKGDFFDPRTVDPERAALLVGSNAVTLKIRKTPGSRNFNSTKLRVCMAAPSQAFSCENHPYLMAWEG